MKSRRTFLGSLLAVFGLSLAPASLAKAIDPADLEINENGYLKYRGFFIIWTGWKHAYYTDTIVGQWCAYENPNGHFRDSGKRFYASYPGAEGPYMPGNVFDISVHAGQDAPTGLTPEKKLKKYQEETFQRLIRFLG